jgi:hypothetical protein
MSDCDAWTKVDDGDTGNCMDWDSLSHVCWILDTGNWRDTCFWRDLSLWNDGAEPWSQVA